MASGEIGAANLRSALQGFAAALEPDLSDYPDTIRDLLENGRIQKFEYTVELFWKYVRSVLISEQRLVPNSPKGVLKDAVACGYLLEGEYPAAIQMYDDRNRCSHCYQQEIIPGILVRLPAHLAVMQAVFGRLPPAGEDERGF